MLNKKLLTKTFRGTTAESERIACEALRTLTSNGVVLDDTLGIHSAGCADARVDALVIVANLVARTTRVFYKKKNQMILNIFHSRMIYRENLPTHSEGRQLA